MPELSFQVQGVEAAQHGMTPLLRFKIGLTSNGSELIQLVALRVQIQFECAQRHYNTEEKRRLFDLFGAPERWGSTLRTRHWTQVDLNIPGFNGSTEASLPVPCTFDLNVASAKYLYALDEGEVPLLFLYSGAIFYQSAEGHLQTKRIAWDRESMYRMPVTTWKALMDLHYPNSAWLSLDRDLFERLYEFKRSQGLATWEQALDRLLPLDRKGEQAA